MSSAFSELSSPGAHVGAFFNKAGSLSTCPCSPGAGLNAVHGSGRTMGLSLTMSWLLGQPYLSEGYLPGELGSQSSLPPRPVIYLCLPPQTLRPSIRSFFSWVSAPPKPAMVISLPSGQGSHWFGFNTPQGQPRDGKEKFMAVLLPWVKSLSNYSQTLGDKGLTFRAQAFPEDQGRCRPIPNFRTGFVRSASTSSQRLGAMPLAQKSPPVF